RSCPSYSSVGLDLLIFPVGVRRRAVALDDPNHVGLVGPDVEAEELHEEDDALGQHEERQRRVGHAERVDQATVPHDHHDELDQLEPGEVLLPPEVLLDTGSQGGQEVVGVHHDVDAGVEHRFEAGDREPSVRDVEVGAEGHGHVVEDVQTADLVELLPKHKEDGLDALRKAEHQVPPRNLEQEHSGGTRGKVGSLQKDVVVSRDEGVVSHARRDGQVSQYHGGVVAQDHMSKVERLGILHHPGSPDLDEVGVARQHRHHGHGTPDEHPSFHARISVWQKPASRIRHSHPASKNGVWSFGGTAPTGVTACSK
ncbi:unnamed protein product, partial [Ixodes hexagonus]